MNKPVAWTNKYNLQAIAEEGSGSVWSEPYFDGDVPLYLNPLDITDEEIKSEAKYFCHSWHSENPERLVLFARAILRKIQEK
jgi:hypothetical protein